MRHQMDALYLKRTKNKIIMAKEFTSFLEKQPNTIEIIEMEFCHLGLHFSNDGIKGENH